MPYGTNPLTWREFWHTQAGLRDVDIAPLRKIILSGQTVAKWPSDPPTYNSCPPPPDDEGFYSDPQAHEHDFPPWDGNGYVCHACPRRHIPCDVCGDTAIQWHHVDDGYGKPTRRFTCMSHDPRVHPPARKTMPSPPPDMPTFNIRAQQHKPSEPCKEQYYGLPCQCPKPHRMKGSR